MGKKKRMAKDESRYLLRGQCNKMKMGSGAVNSVATP